jgi:hypothetical protein
MAKAKLPPEVLEYFRRQGARGGRLGGRAGGLASAASLTPEERVARAKKAVAARERKRRARRRA